LEWWSWSRNESLDVRQNPGVPTGEPVNHTESKPRCRKVIAIHFTPQTGRPIEEVRCQPRGDDLLLPTCGWSPSLFRPHTPHTPHASYCSPTGIVVFGMGLEQAGVTYSSTHAMRSSNRHRESSFQCCQLDASPRAKQRHSTNSLSSPK
jgi:hypothetical protein